MFVGCCSVRIWATYRSRGRQLRPAYCSGLFGTLVHFVLMIACIESRYRGGTQYRLPPPSAASSSDGTMGTGAFRHGSRPAVEAVPGGQHAGGGGHLQVPPPPPAMPRGHFSDGHWSLSPIVTITTAFERCLLAINVV